MRWISFNTRIVLALREALEFEIWDVTLDFE
jgi:hypothetical protein